MARLTSSIVRGFFRVFQAEGQDSIRLQGRAGGTEGYSVTLTTAQLSANRMVTFPDGNVTLLPGVQVPSSRTLTINTGNGLSGGGSYDLSQDRSWTLGLTGQALAFHNLNTIGFVVRAGAGNIISRSLQQGTGMLITNNDGVSGSPSIAFNEAGYGDIRYGTLTASDNVWTTTNRFTQTTIFGPASGARLQANPVDNRYEVWDSLRQKAAMGYLNNLQKYVYEWDEDEVYSQGDLVRVDTTFYESDINNNTSTPPTNWTEVSVNNLPTWTQSEYGFWVYPGDKMIIDGDVRYEDGNWLIENDATFLIVDGATLARLIAMGTDAGEKGFFLYDGTVAENIIAKMIPGELLIGEYQSDDYFRYTVANGLEVKGQNFELFTNSIIIESATPKIALGTDPGSINLSTGTGFFANGLGQFKAGSTQNFISWDGTNILLVGAIRQRTPGVNIIDPNFRGTWIVDTLYFEGDVVIGTDENQYYVTQEHTSTSATRPISGGSWQTYWDLFLQRGEDGADGSSVNIKGTVANESELSTISDPEEGDGYITEDTGHLWVWDGQSWVDVGQIQGDPGDPAPEVIFQYSADGSTGWTTTYDPNADHKWVRSSTDGGSTWSTPAKFVGDDGIDGDPAPFLLVRYGETDEGPWYSTFEEGRNWMQTSNDDGQTWGPSVKIVGEDGEPGQDGADGSSVTIKGTVANESELSTVSDPEVGDGYIAEDTGHLWVWDGEGWIDAGQIQGDPGVDGSFIEYRFRVNSDPTTAPSLNNTARTPSGWSESPPPIGVGEYLWMTKAKIDADDLLETNWTSPTRISGEKGNQGDQGDPGPGLVFRGEYDGSTTYFADDVRVDVVKSGSDYYYALQDNFSGVAPPNASYWGLMSQFDSIATGLLLTQDAAITRTLTLGEGEATGIIRSAGTTFAGGSDGFWLGYDGGIAKFKVGNSDSYFKWDGSAKFAGDLTGTNMLLDGRLTVDLGDNRSLQFGEGVTTEGSDPMLRGMVFGLEEAVSIFSQPHFWVSDNNRDTYFKVGGSSGIDYDSTRDGIGEFPLHIGSNTRFSGALDGVGGSFTGNLAGANMELSGNIIVEGTILSNSTNEGQPVLARIDDHFEVYGRQNIINGSTAFNDHRLRMRAGFGFSQLLFSHVNHGTGTPPDIGANSGMAESFRIHHTANSGMVNEDDLRIGVFPGGGDRIKGLYINKDTGKVAIGNVPFDVDDSTMVIDMQNNLIKVNSDGITTSGDITSGRISLSNTQRANGNFYTGTTDPINNTRVNYDGSFHANNLRAHNLLTLRGTTGAASPSALAFDGVSNTGLSVFPVSDEGYMRFFTDGSQVMNLTNNQQVLIGTDSTGDGERLRVSGEIFATQGKGTATIHGVNTFQTTNGLAGVRGSGGDTGSGYLAGRLDGISAGVIGVQGTRPEGVAGYFKGTVNIDTVEGALIVPRMTTTERNDLTAVDGMIIYNTSLADFQFRKGGVWVRYDEW